jgi:hypothetical protein
MQKQLFLLDSFRGINGRSSTGKTVSHQYSALSQGRNQALFLGPKCQDNPAAARRERFGFGRNKGLLWRAR